jgi:hypothetical protein
MMHPWEALLLVVAVLMTIVALLTKGPLAAFIADRVERGEPRRMRDPIYALLRREVEKAAKRLEAMPYEDLLRSVASEDASWDTVVDGVAISFSTEIFQIKRDGDAGICIDARAEPNRTRWQPSYQFFKRKDGSVYRPAV